MPVPVRNYLDKVSDTFTGAVDWIRTDSTELEKFEAYREQRRKFGESIKKHKLEYSTPSNIKICAITYNVAELEEIEDSTVYASLFENAQEWDVLAIALQEVDVGSYALAMEVTGAGQMWSDVIEKELLKVSKDFVKVLNSQLVGVMLLLFVKSQHTQYLRHLHSQGVRLGRTVLGGRLGNKGCLAVRFTLYDRSFLILGGHFAALQENLDNRNADYKEVRSTLRFPDLPPDADDEVDRFPLQKVHDLFPLFAPAGYTPPEQKAFDVDYCLWMGDLNYRVDLTYEEVIEKLKVNDYESLRQKDQLMRCKKEGICFPDFDEGLLDFHPSFKYDIGTQVYDTSAKHRIPSWTDRVLFKVKEPNESDSLSNWLNQLTYRRYEILTSDHRPVGAIFDARVLKSNLEEADKVVEKLLSEDKPKPAYERTQCFCAV